MALAVRSGDAGKFLDLSDLAIGAGEEQDSHAQVARCREIVLGVVDEEALAWGEADLCRGQLVDFGAGLEIGRASCRERV